MASISWTDKVVFYHLPRTGSEFLAKMLYEDCNFLPYMFDPTNEQLEHILDRGMRHTLNDVFPQIIEEDFYEAVVVRNPYDRFLSCWKYIHKNKLEASNTDLDYRKLDKIDYLVKHWDDLTNKSKFYLETQWNHIRGRELKIIKYENIYDDLHAILRKIGKDYMFPSFIPKVQNKKNKRKIIEFVTDFYEEDLKYFKYETIEEVD